jgi:hypothetical protein
MLSRHEVTTTQEMLGVYLVPNGDTSSQVEKLLILASPKKGCMDSTYHYNMVFFLPPLCPQHLSYGLGTNNVIPSFLCPFSHGDL